MLSLARIGVEGYCTYSGEYIYIRKKHNLPLIFGSKFCIHIPRSRYTWDESAIADPGPATVTWGSGSSAGQAHLRWNWVEFSILTEECKRDYFVADTVPEDAMVYLKADNRESFDPAGDHMTWANLAFPDSEAHFEAPAGYDAAEQAIVFQQDTDANIDVDAVGFQYSGNFAIEIVVKPGTTQAGYAGLFGDHDCAAGGVGIVCQQQGGTTNSYYFGYGMGAGWNDVTDASGAQIPIVLDPTVWNHVVISANHHAKPPVIEVWNGGALVGTHDYQVMAVQCPPGTTLEIGDGWARGDSRRWNGEYKLFAMYSEPKSADDVAAMYAAFQTNQGGGGGH